MTVTMKDIAKAAGVSVVTVSRAFNDKPDIDEKTKERILSLASKMNYRPNILAQSLRAKTTKSVGIIIPDISDPFYADIFKGCSTSAKHFGYDIILSVLSQQGCDVQEEIEAMRTLLGKRVDGLLLQPENEEKGYIEALEMCSVPFVLWNRKSLFLDCSYVTNNHEYGSFLAARHLFEKGHREIVYFIRTPRTGTVIERIEGCKRAAREKGLPESAIRVLECGDNARDAYVLATKILQEKEKLTAIYAWDDVMAIGVEKAVLNLGLKIPHDIAVVGYNDIEIAAFMSPPLTTVRQKTGEIGEKAFEMLIRKIRNESPVENIVLEPELIIRQTS